jgi:cell division septum initiation protein DivIVA
MDQIKEAFQKVKQDISSLEEEISLIKQYLHENGEKLTSLDNKIQNLTQKIGENLQNIPPQNPTYNLPNSTVPTDNPTHNLPFEALKAQKLSISTGNDGVPTNKPTNQQTNQHIENEREEVFGTALEVLNSLDNIKKEIRHKFKKITDQEFLVFSTIYQMEQEGEVDYRSVAKKLNLTETSIRDYVGRLIKKGIPVEKTKINNKMINLSISDNLKKIAPLPVILQLREL